MAITKLIMAADVVSTCFADKNFYPAYIADGLIVSAQLDWLKNKIGKDYYNEITGQYPDFTGAADNLTVFNDYIKPALCWQVAYSVVPFVAHKTNNAGVIDDFFDTGKPAESSSMEQSRKSFLSIAESYLNGLIDYITDKDNAVNFLTYNNRTDGSDSQTSVEYFGGLVIDRSNPVTHKGHEYFGNEVAFGFGVCPDCGYSTCQCYD